MIALPNSPSASSPKWIFRVAGMEVSTLRGRPIFPGSAGIGKPPSPEETALQFPERIMENYSGLGGGGLAVRERGLNGNEIRF